MKARTHIRLRRAVTSLLMLVMLLTTLPTAAFAAVKAAPEYCFGALGASTEARMIPGIYTIAVEPEGADIAIAGSTLEIMNNGDAWLSVLLDEESVCAAPWEIAQAHQPDAAAEAAEVLSRNAQDMVTGLRFPLPYTNQDGVFIRMNGHPCFLHILFSGAAHCPQAEADRVDAQIAALDEMGPDSCAAVSEARSSYDWLIPEAQALVRSLTALESAEAELAERRAHADDQVLADQVIALIDAIGAVTPDTVDAVKAANSAYANLNPAQRALVTNAAALAEANVELRPVETAAAVVTAMEQIAALGQITLDSSAAVEAARRACDVLDEDALAEVENLADLEAAEAALAALTADAEDKAQAAQVMDLIDAIGEEVTLESETAVKAANSAYANLNPAQRKLVTNARDLFSAEEALKALQDADDAKAAEEQIAALGEIGLDSKDDIKAAHRTYNGLRKSGRARITNLSALEAADAKLAELESHGRGRDEVAEAARLIDAIGERVTLGSAPEIKAANSAYANLNPAQRKQVRNAAALEEANARLNALRDAARADAVEDRIAQLDGVAMDSHAVRRAYNALRESAKVQVNNLTELEVAEARQSSLTADAEDKAQADRVIALIDAIGEVTMDSGDAIRAANSAYANLDPVQRKLVSNVSSLKAADAKLHALRDIVAQADHAEEDQAAAAAVDEQIAALGEIGLDSKAAVKAARKAYNALSGNARAKVENYPTLRTAERTLAALRASEKDQAEARETIRLIDAIGEVDLSSEAAIKAANSAYVNLNPAQRKLVTNYFVLKAANAKLASTKQEMAHCSIAA